MKHLVLKLVMESIVSKRDIQGFFTGVLLGLPWVLTFLILTGCAHDYEQQAKMDRINRDYHAFVQECGFIEGQMQIDRPFTSRRVQNAPPTVWEKQDAICVFSGGYMRLYE